MFILADLIHFHLLSHFTFLTLIIVKLLCNLESSPRNWSKKLSSLEMKSFKVFNMKKWRNFQFLKFPKKNAGPDIKFIFNSSSFDTSERFIVFFFLLLSIEQLFFHSHNHVLTHPSSTFGKYKSLHNSTQTQRHTHSSLEPHKTKNDKVFLSFSSHLHFIFV